ncbi:MAG TPA: substrate-binding domain-containing protein [Thermogutta sp.]|nr:substrate-binding domain-containing protein [Thermogutta sp.]HPU06730.1 substrate-binding domain-containing protein [Thermogutta sp.]HQF12876.1 substrate-binding domain-containing protein [Thermogutta sp.]
MQLRTYTHGMLVSFLILTSLSLSCRSQTGEGIAREKKLTIAVIPKSTGAEFWETVEEGAREAAERLNVQMKWEGPLTETELAEQNKIIENMISLQVDGIALAPLNRTAQRRTVERAVQAGIPVVIFDSEIDGDAHVSFVATNNKQGGVLAAQHLAELLGEKKGRVMVLRFVQGTGSTEARAEGFIETAKAAGFEIVADPYPEDATVAGCKKTAANTLEGFVKNNELQLDGIFACNDRSTLGMLAALDDLRKSGVKVNAKFIGFDFTPRLVEAIQQGDIDALIAQNPRKMGRLAVETLVSYLRGQQVPKYIDTGVEVVTRSRLESDPAIRQLVGLKDK